MTSRDFAFWLQGYFEVANPQQLTAVELTLIKRHLNLVFKHEIDPSMPDPSGALQAIHDGFKPTDGPNSALHIQKSGLDGGSGLIRC